jgi:hypothetical protein
MTKRTLILKVNEKLGAISRGRHSLSEFLAAAAEIHPDLSPALEGIYFGREGKVHEELHGELRGAWLAFGWYAPADRPVVEFAYVS